MTGETSIDRSDLPARHPPASELLRALADRGTEGRITIGELLDAFGERAFGILMILFSLPSMIPIPFLGGLFGYPLLFIALQMATGRPKPWLPNFIAARAIERRALAKCVNGVEPRLKRIEKVLKPRFTRLFTAKMDKVIGWFGVGAAISIIFPFPGTNFPPALGLIIASLALAEEDGMVLFLGLAILTAALTYTTIVIGGSFYAAWLLVTGLLGF